ncbi:MAG: magnesium transporter [Kiritimatiellae bacterium]|nr:magnesium transporter [Kiritimatiellia bacterium]
MPASDVQDEFLFERIEAEDWDAVAAALAAYHPADIARIITRAPSATYRKLFDRVPEDLKPHVLSELEGQAGSDILEALSSSDIVEIVEDMAPDDAADVLGDLPEDRSEEVLHLMDEEDAHELRRLLKYDEDTAGGIMTTNVVALRGAQTVQAAVEAIAYVESDAPFFYAYVVDDRRVLKGYVHLWELLKERGRQRPLDDLVHADVISAAVDMDQEEVARLMARYDLSALPVVDGKRRLVGRITIDDVVDVMEEEASEDILRLAGSDDEELENVSVLRTCRIRLPWLLITLVTGFVTSMILKQFVAHIAEVLVLSFFVPIVLAMGGNTGVQSSTLTVRRIALGDLHTENIWRILLREIGVGAIMGAVCGLAIALWAVLLVRISPGYAPSHSPLEIALIVALALFGAMTFAAMFGAFVPIALNAIGIDPAVASGPFVTTTNDLSALLIYFAFTVVLVRAFG